VDKWVYMILFVFICLFLLSLQSLLEFESFNNSSFIRCRELDFLGVGMISYMCAMECVFFSCKSWL